MKRLLSPVVGLALCLLLGTNLVLAHGRRDPAPTSALSNANSRGDGTSPLPLAPATLSDLEISLWPEYDRTEMLVIYRGYFAPDTPLPIPVEIRIPAQVDEPTAVAFAGEGGQRFNQEYTTRVEEEQIVVSFELDSLGFQLEYYDPLETDSTGQRAYTFTYLADFPVTELRLDFQVPPTAQAFTLDPVADSVETQSNGLTYHLVQAGPLAQGEALAWTLTYQKADSSLTAGASPTGATPGQTAAQALRAATAAGEGDSSTVVIFVIAFVALAAVGAAAFWLGRQTRPASEGAGRPRLYGKTKRRGSGRSGARGRGDPAPTSGQQPAAAQRSQGEPGAALYCHACGVQLRYDSEFCHRCGAAIRHD